MGNINYLKTEKHIFQIKQRETIQKIENSKNLKKIFYKIKLFFINDYLKFLKAEIKILKR